jgi:hypothetical protein
VTVQWWLAFGGAIVGAVVGEIVGCDQTNQIRRVRRRKRPLPSSTAGVRFVAGRVVSFVIALIGPPVRRLVKHDASSS